MIFFRVQSLLWNFKYLLTLLSKPEYWVITDSNNNIITVHLVKNIFCKKKYYNYILVKHFGFEMHFIWQSVSKSVTLRGECNFLVYYIRYTAEIFSEDSYSLCVSSSLFCLNVCKSCFEYIKYYFIKVSWFYLLYIFWQLTSAL